MVISETIREQRKKQSKTQEELANDIGVSKKTISNWETGKTIPDFYYLKQLSLQFDIPLGELLHEEDLSKKEVSKLSFKPFILFLIIGFAVLPIIYKLYPNTLTASLFFFGYLLLIVFSAILLVLACIPSLLSFIKNHK